MKALPHRAASSVCGLLLLSYTLANVAQVPPVVVTATRFPIAAHKPPAASTVITREDIDRLQVTNLPDLLKGTAGIDISESGGSGKVTNLFMRGTEADQVLVNPNVA